MLLLLLLVPLLLLPGDPEERWFSFDTSVHVPREQMACYLTRTTADTHKVIRDNLHETPVYGGWVDAKGPRYCPSIEDKIVRFAEKDSHQVGRGGGGGQGVSSSCCAWRGGGGLVQVLLGPGRAQVLSSANWDFQPAARCIANAVRG